jgi:hypothetical protein
MALPFYISKDDMTNLLTQYDIHRADGKALRGFVFRIDEHENEDGLFPDPIYSAMPIIGDITEEEIVTNNELGIGCPYPPGYPRALRSDV